MDTVIDNEDAKQLLEAYRKAEQWDYLNYEAPGDTREEAAYREWANWLERTLNRVLFATALICCAAVCLAAYAVLIK